MKDSEPDSRQPKKKTSSKERVVYIPHVHKAAPEKAEPIAEKPSGGKDLTNGKMSAPLVVKHPKKGEVEPGFYPLGHPEPLHETGIFAKAPPPIQEEKVRARVPAGPLPPPPPPIPPVPLEVSTEPGSVISPEPGSIPLEDNEPPEQTTPTEQTESVFSSGEFGQDGENSQQSTEQSPSEIVSLNEYKRWQLSLLFSWLVVVPLLPLIGVVLSLISLRSRRLSKQILMVCGIGLVMTLVQLVTLSYLLHQHSIHQQQTAWRAANGSHLQELLQSADSDIALTTQAIKNNSSTSLLAACAAVGADSTALSKIPRLPQAAYQSDLIQTIGLLSQGAQECISGDQSSNSTQLGEGLSDFTEATAYQASLQIYT